jgi:uncharacterized SAM-binding protein YcdF (DUF218 family)
MATRLPRAGEVPVDALFVLAGGENRIAEGYRAWREGRGRELYILGAGPEAALAKILPAHSTLPPGDADRLHVEGWSENTLENAFSAKSVAGERDFRTVCLVTSDYHVPRAYYTLRKFLPPGTTLSVMPVDSAWRGKRILGRTLRRFFVESWKYWGYRLFLMYE